MSIGRLVEQKCWFAGEQLCAFEESAEILFAGDVQRALLAGEDKHGFVFHFQPLEPDDPEILAALFPNLTLAQFHPGSIPLRLEGWP